YEQIIVIFLIANCPLNAFLIAIIIRHQQLSYYSLFFVILLAVSQINIIFDAHLVAAFFAKTFRKPNSFLLSLNASKRRINIRSDSIRTRLLLAHQIAALHTQKAYGICYAKYGLANLNTFLRVCQIYFFCGFLKIIFCFIFFSIWLIT